jgi:aspartate kinase
MSVLVQKYGGSSVADVEKIGRVADKVAAAKRAGHDVVVVVSAMGKTTDELLALARSAAPGQDPPRRELDMLVSTGERVSMALLSIAIHARGCDAISFTGSQSGIITNDRHFDARIIEVRPHRIEDELARGRVVIVAGYQGMSYRREITTLGRGGSDTTAVALAAALGAERCEIYSDVDGVYSADPRVVPDARHLPEIDLACLQEMAEAGAKVLNAQAVEWARRAKISIHARRTGDAPGEGRETICVERTPRRGALADVDVERTEPANVRAVVGLDRVVGVRFDSRHLARFAEVAAELRLPLLDLHAGSAGASASIPLLNVPDWDRCRARIEAAMGADVKLVKGCAVVSVVGHDLVMLGGLVQMSKALESVGCVPTAVSAGPLRIAATIDAAKLAEAQRAAHAAFVPLD